MGQTLEEDRQLVIQCVSGDRTAAELFVREYSDPVYRFVQLALMARHVPFNSHDLEDLHNTVFLNLFDNNCRKLGQYKGKNGCRLSSWLRVVVVRTVLNHLRKKGPVDLGSRKMKTSLEDMPEMEAKQEQTWAMLEKSEQMHMIQEGIRTLPPRDRLFMKLHFEKGLPVEKVAETMQVSTDSLYTLKHRTIKKLKDYISSASEKNNQTL